MTYKEKRGEENHNVSQKWLPDIEEKKKVAQFVVMATNIRY